MTQLERLRREIVELSPAVLEDFRAWFAAFDVELWDREIDRDAGSGALDGRADQALTEHGAGQTTPL